MENPKFHLRIIPLVNLTPISINPVDRTVDARLKGLKVEISKSHIITPLLVAVDPKDTKHTFWIVDGNRRFKIAKEMGLTSIACNVMETKINNLGSLFLSVNTHLSFSGFQKLCLMRNSGLFPTPKDKVNYQWVIDLAGMEIIDLMIENRNALPNTVNWTKKIAQYVKLWPQKEDIKKVLYWLVTQKAQYKSRIAYNASFSRHAWRDIILKDKALPFGNK